MGAGNFHSYNYNGDEPTASTCTCTQASKLNFVATFAGKMVYRYKLLVDSLCISRDTCTFHVHYTAFYMKHKIADHSQPNKINHTFHVFDILTVCHQELTSIKIKSSDQESIECECSSSPQSIFIPLFCSIVGWNQINLVPTS